FAIGTMLAAEEALSTKQYDQFREKSEKNFQKAAEFFSVLVKKVNRLLEEKNKDHPGGNISFLPVTSKVRDKTIYGIPGFTVAYTLSGSLYQEVQTGGDPTYLQDPRGIYSGTLYLSIEVEGMDSLDYAFVEGCCLPNGELNETADWRQILKRFPDRPEIRKTLLAAFIDRTVSPAKLTRNLSGEFTVTITSENGLGKAQLSGAFNSLSDETDFQFSHSIFTLFLAPKAIETPNGPENLGQPQYNVILTSVPGAGLSQIHVRVTDANRAATVSDDTTYTEFSGDGRALVIPVSKQGDVFDQLPYPPGIIITK
ncbi:MAG: hypothetical protein J6V01_07840, partial [Clostridia bacterium]|nr:hypothetical protein [Clostridia bacterium]